jgi:diguanylate cyclase (GGDEF)-like protein
MTVGKFSGDMVDAIAQEQYRAFGRKMPTFYFLLAAVTVLEAALFWGDAPLFVGIILPVLIAGACISRAVYWLRRKQFHLASGEAVRHLRRATVVTSGLAVIYCVWDLLLYGYGGPEKAPVLLFYVACTAICSIFFLMHVRVAALAVVTVLLIPFFAIISTLHDGPSGFIVANVLMVCTGMLLVMKGYFKDFIDLVQSRQNLALQEQAALQLSEENYRLANVDELTGLPNRRRFFGDLAEATRLPPHIAAALAVGIVDIDGFKPINDAHGHTAGDRTLEIVGKRLETACAGVGRVYRLGGDEFSIILNNDDRDKLLELGSDIITAISEPIDMGGLGVIVTCSIGFSPYDEQSRTSDSLYEHADFALYHAKRNGKAEALVFEKQHELELTATTRIQQALQQADLEAELSLMFQPIVDSRSGRAVAFESLARWNSPALGPVSPSQFVPAAEQANLMDRITPVLFRKMLAAAQLFPEETRLSFNLSAQDIANASRIDLLINLLVASCVDPSRIDFELTETAMVGSFGAASANVMRLRALGAGISLDDFGTGYSSLAYVHNLPLTKMKVDRSFVRDLESNPASRKIIQSVQALCRDLELDCIVEGVETEGQLRRLSDIGCTTIQGYFYAKPMILEEAFAFLEEAAGAPQLQLAV